MTSAGSRGENLEREKPFSIGINYRPGETAMYGWERFDSSIAKIDSREMSWVRVDITLEEYQESPSEHLPRLCRNFQGRFL
jgi:hypothetical protein